MINRVVLTGRLTRDLELRRTQSRTSVVSFTLAVDRSRKVEGQPEADFINCVAWNRQAEAMAQYLHRGSLIGVDGRLQTRNYENQQGQRVYITEVLVESFAFLEPRANAKPHQTPPKPSPSTSDGYYRTDTSDVDTIGIEGDDLPF